MRTSPRGTSVLALLFVTLVVALATAMLIVRKDDAAGGVTVAVVLVATVGVGAFTAAKRPRHPTGWLMAGTATSFAFGTFATDYVQSSLASGESFPATTAVGWLSTWAAAPAIGLGVLLVMTFPTGSFDSRVVRGLGGAVVVVTAVHAVTLALTPGPLPVAGALDNPLGVRGVGNALEMFGSMAGTLLALAGCAALVRLLVRSRRAAAAEREQIRIVGWAFLLAAVALAGAMAVSGPLNEYSFYFAAISLSALPMAMGYAVVRHDLFEIDVFINRALVFGVLTVGVAALYVLVVGITGAVFGGSLDLRISLLAATVVAVAFGPAHERIQRRVDRMIYGERAAPYAALTGLSARLEDATGPERLLPDAVEEIGTSLKLRAVSVDLLHDQVLVRGCGWGTETGDPCELFELIHGGELVGQLSVWARPGEQLRTRDRTLLEALCGPVAAAAHATAATRDLHESRQALVTVTGEERRRLRADLHDGLGPELAGVGLAVAAARLELRRDPHAADALLEQVLEQVRGAVSQVRHLVDGLAPAVEQLGLVGAVRQGADRLGNGDTLRIDVVTSPIPPLSAAVEVAAYRIAMEAMTNVVRHAHAHSCTVRLRSEDSRLLIDVTDDGSGLPNTVVPGVGLTSMRQRAHELGGVFSIERSATGGTGVRAELPLS